jgi:hypothetical protein
VSLESYIAYELGSEVEVEYLIPPKAEGMSGSVPVHLMTPSGVVRLD